jgi:CheY-like chemotaxis protein
VTSSAPLSLRVLVVASDASILASTVDCLRRGGHEVMAARDAAEGLRLAGTLPQVIIVDERLDGDLTGGDVCRRLKTLPATALVPLLHLVPSRAATEANATGLAATADGSLEHPVDPAALVVAVQALAARERLSQVE